VSRIRTLFKSLSNPRSLLSQTATYGVFRVINMALPILLVPIMTRYMSPEDYGVMSSFTIAVSLTSPLVGFGMLSVIRRRYFDRDEIDFPAYILGTLVIFAMALLTVAPLCFVAHRLLGLGERVPIAWVFVFLLWMTGFTLQGFHITFLQLEGRSRAFGMATVYVTVVNLCVSLVFVVALEMGWQGRVLGPVAAYTVAGGVAIASLARRLRPWPKFNVGYIKDALRYAAPTIPYAMLERAITATDRLVVIAYLGVAVGGEYAVSAQVAGVIGVIVQAFVTAWTPWVYERLKGDAVEGHKAVVRAIYVALGGLLVCGLGVLLVAEYALPFIVGPKFVEAGRFVPWLVAGFTVRSAGLLFMAIVAFREKHAVLGWLSIVSGLLNYPLSVFMVGLNGANGAAQATFAIYAINLVLVLVVALRVQKLPWLRT